MHPHPPPKKHRKDTTSLLLGITPNYANSFGLSEEESKPEVNSDEKQPLKKQQLHIPYMVPSLLKISNVDSRYPSIVTHNHFLEDYPDVLQMEQMDGIDLSIIHVNIKLTLVTMSHRFGVHRLIATYGPSVPSSVMETPFAGTTILQYESGKEKDHRRKDAKRKNRNSNDEASTTSRHQRKKSVAANSSASELLARYLSFKASEIQLWRSVVDEAKTKLDIDFDEFDPLALHAQLMQPMLKEEENFDNFKKKFVNAFLKDAKPPGLVQGTMHHHRQAEFVASVKRSVEFDELVPTQLNLFPQVRRAPRQLDPIKTHQERCRKRMDVIADQQDLGNEGQHLLFWLTNTAIAANEGQMQRNGHVPPVRRIL